MALPLEELTAGLIYTCIVNVKQIYATSTIMQVKYAEYLHNLI